MAEKVAKVGVKREPGFLYFLRGSDVWKTPMKRAGGPSAAGKAEKVAARGAPQCSRGQAPSAALRLSPTFRADNGQRMKPQAASVMTNVRTEPHAKRRRML